MPIEREHHAALARRADPAAGGDRSAAAPPAPRSARSGSRPSARPARRRADPAPGGSPARSDARGSGAARPARSRRARTRRAAAPARLPLPADTPADTAHRTRVRQRRTTSVNWTTSSSSVSRRRLWYATQRTPPQLQQRSRFGSSRRSAVARGAADRRRAICALPCPTPRNGRRMLRGRARFRQARFAVLVFFIGHNLPKRGRQSAGDARLQTVRDQHGREDGE